MTKYNRPNGKLFGSSASNIGVFGSGQAGETYTTTTDPNTANSLGTHWEDGWNGAVVSQAPYTAPFIEDMNAVNYVNSYNSAYLLQRGIPEYDANEEYQADSVCTYNGEIWICLQDATTGITPTEGANWHAQTEVPVMVDNEILVGQTGVGATKTDTLNQGDIVASTSGLDIKTGVIVNADINGSANISESKLNLAYTTSTLNTNIGNVSSDLNTHTTNSNNPHSTTLANLVGNNLSTPSADDTLVYDGVNSEWINQENSLDNLSNATITTPSNKDVLWYSGGSWVNTSDVNNHMVNKNNPHETEFANLHDATISTPSDQDTVVYDGNSSKWINQPNTVENLKNTNISTISDGQILSYDSGNSEWINTTNSIDNLSNTSITSATLGDILTYDGSDWINTPNTGGSLSGLSDTTITTPQQNNVLLYDSVSSKWINSPIIEINDIANINSASANITLTASDKRHQILTNTEGFDVILPSTNVKAGEKFIFDFEPSSALDFYATTSFCFKASDSSEINYCHSPHFTYTFIAKTNTPSTSTDWCFEWSLSKHATLEGSYEQSSITATQYTVADRQSLNLFTIYRGVWDIILTYGFMGGTVGTQIPWGAVLVTTSGGTLGNTDNRAGIFIQQSLPCTNSANSINIPSGVNIPDRNMLPISSSWLWKSTRRSMGVSMYVFIYNVGSTDSVYFKGLTNLRLVAPYLDAGVE